MIEYNKFLGLVIESNFNGKLALLAMENVRQINKNINTQSIINKLETSQIGGLLDNKRGRDMEENKEYQNKKIKFENPTVQKINDLAAIDTLMKINEFNVNNVFCTISMNNQNNDNENIVVKYNNFNTPENVDSCDYFCILQNNNNYVHYLYDNNSDLLLHENYIGKNLHMTIYDMNNYHKYKYIGKLLSIDTIQIVGECQSDRYASVLDNSNCQRIDKFMFKIDGAILIDEKARSYQIYELAIFTPLGV